MQQGEGLLLSFFNCIDTTPKADSCGYFSLALSVVSKIELICGEMRTIHGS